MSSANNSLVSPNFFNTSNDGSKFKHNFTNRYLGDEDLRKPSREIGDAITEVTKKEIFGRAAQKIDTAYSGAKPSNLVDNEVQYIKYTPNQQGDGHNAGATQRMIKMHTVQKDPLAPSQFKHKRIPKGPGSPPVTIMHSPPRKLTLKDQQDWRIPPCISNWKNAKGFTIPLEMRLSADGRTLQENTINEKFAKLADSFYIAERKSRQDIEERNKIQKQMAYKEYLKKEEDMRQQAALAREEKNKIYTKDDEETGKRRNPYVNREEEEAKQERDQIRYIAKREIERERRLEVAAKKKSKSVRDADRDISEKIALGQAQPTAQEVMYDQRLFNQSAGLDTGFGDEDEYHAFDKPLFADKTSRSIYGAVKEVPDDEEGGEGQDDDKKKVNKMLSSSGPNRGFEGAAEHKGTRNKPVEFEKHDDDIFGLDSFLEPSKKVKK